MQEEEEKNGDYCVVAVVVERKSVHSEVIATFTNIAKVVYTQD